MRSDSLLSPVVAIAADDAFVMPLAVTIRSAIDTLRSDARLTVYVLDGGIGSANRRRLLRSWPAERIAVEWIPVSPALLAGLPDPGRLSQATYFRTLLPRLLPPHVSRVVYLDSDIIVCADLTSLWQHDMNGYLCLGAQDPAHPYVDAAVALEHYEVRGRHLGLACPIPNYRSLGLDPRTPYINAGVMVIDVDAWRRLDIASQLHACLASNSEHLIGRDQYAVNVVLSGRCGVIDPRWNQGAYIFKYPSWQDSPFTREVFEQQRNDPYVIHFTTSKKPWLTKCQHPLRQRYFDILDRTAWAGWRPAAPGSFRARTRRLREAFTAVFERRV